MKKKKKEEEKEEEETTTKLIRSKLLSDYARHLSVHTTSSNYYTK